jgi:hypothetical protein
MLTRLIYHSENHIGGTSGKMVASLNTIMEAAIRNNQRANITGALIFDSLWFVQILEGEREAVSETLRRIMRDERHDNVTVMDATLIEQRHFGNWWMGLGTTRDESLYARHGITRFNPRQMTGAQALAIALDLAAVGLSRKLAPA